MSHLGPVADSLEVVKGPDNSSKHKANFPRAVIATLYLISEMQKNIFYWFCLITLIFLVVAEAGSRQKQIRAFL